MLSNPRCAARSCFSRRSKNGPRPGRRPNLDAVEKNESRTVRQRGPDCPRASSKGVPPQPTVSGAVSTRPPYFQAVRRGQGPHYSNIVGLIRSVHGVRSSPSRHSELIALPPKHMLITRARMDGRVQLERGAGLLRQEQRRGLHAGRHGRVQSTMKLSWSSQRVLHPCRSACAAPLRLPLFALATRVPKRAKKLSF
jgi:hypothetical protein